MPQISRVHALFVLVNMAIGAVVGAATALSPGFASLPVPIFGWLVLGVLLTDLAIGALAGQHPSAVVTMPVRIVALLVAFVASFVVKGALTA